MRAKILGGLMLLASLVALGQEPTQQQPTNPPVPAPQERSSKPPTPSAEQPKPPEIPSAMEKTLTYTPQPATNPEVFKPSELAQKFKFGKTELEFYKQIEAFDKYIEDKGWIYDDPVVTGYVERVGRSVVPPNAPENVKYRFRVLRDPEPNAFALPNGSIYVHTGLLSRLQNEAQLAGVLAHESTHVFNRHTYATYHDMRKKVVLLEVLDVGLMGAAAAGANYQILNAIGNLAPLAVINSIFGYERSLEHEADVYAVSVMKEAGYDPMEIAHALEMLKKGPEVDLTDEAVFWSDHPKLEQRVKDTAEIAEHIGHPEGGGKTLANDFIISTKNAVRHDAGLAILTGRPRTAVAIANRLLSTEPNNPDNYALLGDAYRALGARTAVPEADELTNDGKKATRKLMRKKTAAEYDQALLALPRGSEKRAENCKQAQAAYDKALDMDPTNANAFRGMGLLRESQDRNAEALTNLRRYLELSPSAKDARYIRQHTEALQKKIDTESKPIEGAQ